MRKNNYKDFCKDIYNNIFNSTYQGLYQKHKHKPTDKSKKEFETAAQKEAIKQSVIYGLEKFPKVNAAEIWKAIYEVHVHHKSGIDNSDIINKVVSADQSWKKSSGHAFEEMVNGGGINQKVNGWHSMYIFTNEKSEGRIYHTNIEFDTFKQHAKEAANMWLTQRQWFNEDWKPTNNK